LHALPGQQIWVSAPHGWQVAGSPAQVRFGPQALFVQQICVAPPHGTTQDPPWHSRPVPHVFPEQQVCPAAPQAG